MKKMVIKRWVIGGILLLTCFPKISMANQAVKIVFNGTELKLDIPAVVEDGTTLVPMRNVFEAFGVTPQWDGKTQSITAIKGDTTIWLQLNNKMSKVGDKQINLNVPPKIKNGYTLVPLRFISESLGITPDWDQETQTITIGKKEEATFEAMPITASNEISVMFSVSEEGITDVEREYLDLREWMIKQDMIFDLTGSILESKDIALYHKSQREIEDFDYMDYEQRKQLIEDVRDYYGPWYTYKEKNAAFYYGVEDNEEFIQYVLLLDSRKNPVAFVKLDGIKKEGSAKGTVFLY